MYEQPNTQLLYGLPSQYKLNPPKFEPEVFKQYLPQQNAEIARNLFQQPTNFDSTDVKQSWKAAPNPELLKGLPETVYLLPEFADSPSYYYGLTDSIYPQNIESSKQQTNNQLKKLDDNNRNAGETYRPFEIYQSTLPVLSPREYEAQSRVYGLKTDWKAAQEQIDALQKLNPQTEEDKKKIQAQIDGLKYQQKNYADAAAVIRNAAGAMGWDMTGMGANDNFDVATQLMAINQNRGMAELLDMPSTSAQKRQIYYQMMDRGVAPHIARRVAESYHDEFRENNIQKLMEGIRVYGTNGDGSLNEFGQMLAGKLYNENPYMYGNIVNGFASPKDIFGVNANLSNTQLAQDAADRRALRNNQNAADIAKANLIARIGIADADRVQKERHHQDNLKFNYDKLGVDTQLRIASLEKSGSATKNKIAEEIQNLMDIGYNQEQASEMVMRKHYSNSFNVERDANGKPIKLSDTEKAANRIKFRMGSVEHYLQANDFAKTKEMTAQWREALNSTDFKDAEYYDKETVDGVLTYLDLCDAVCDGKITLEEFDKQKRRLTGKTYADDLKENLYSSGDQKMANIMNRR